MQINVKNIRTKLGMTQAEFASKLGITKGTVSTWENGTRLPGLSTVNKICELFDLSYEQVIGSKDVEYRIQVHDIKSDKEVLNYITKNENDCLKDALLSACKLLENKYPGMDPVVIYQKLLADAAKERMVNTND